jgi:hypothetical protein
MDTETCNIAKIIAEASSNVIQELPVIDKTPMKVWVEPEEEKLFYGTIYQPDSCKKTEIIVLDDSGCMGNVISSELVQALGITTFTPTSPVTVIFGKKGVSATTNLQAKVWLQVNGWKKEMTLAVLDIGYDVILGMPFDSLITVLHQSWKQQLKIFKTQSGTVHRWYGVNYKVARGGKPVLTCCLQDIRSSDTTFIGTIRRNVLDAITEDEAATVYVNNIASKTSAAPIQDPEAFKKSLKPEVLAIIEQYPDAFREPFSAEELPQRFTGKF